MTLCPALSAIKASDVPKPEEQPVISQTSGLVEVVIVSIIEKLFRNLYRYIARN